MRTFVRAGAAAVVATVVATVASAQQAQQQPAPPAGLAVGMMAPDFAISAATRYGVLRDSVRLSDFRGRTVVLAFFPRARSKG